MTFPRLSVSLVLALAACGEEPASKPAEPAPPAAEAPKSTRFDLSAQAKDLNVIVISMDALRYDRTGASGNKDGLTPNLDKLQEEMVVFHNATSAAPWTVPSHMAIWTGLWPTRHGVVNKLQVVDGKQVGDAALAADIPTFPEQLAKAGWKGVAFTGGAGVSGRFGYNRGFETYIDDQKFAGFDYSVPLATKWLDENKDQRFVMFLHGYDAHGQHPLVDQDPRAAVPDYKGKLDGGIEEQAKLREEGLAAIQNPGDPAKLTSIDAEDARFMLKVYDAKVKEADARLGTFVAKLKELGLYDKSLIVVISDHGEEFMEHGYVDHGATLCQHQLHTVLSMRFPGDAKREDVRTPVRMIDTFPTIFAALGVEGPANVDGKSLLPLLRGEQADLPVFAESDYRLFVHQRMARRGDQKLILDLEDGQKELFDLATDPQETKDLSGADPRAAYEIEQQLRGWMDATRTDPQTYMGVREEPIKIF